ncbi:polyprenyl synthetase family protein [Spirochaeta cellobiosiphila]|uniref:polyprenyl synthetase family protein n=1 Tax=Spirochaeta cellobiosiphila TaxID=504483 RepID=UPI00040BEBF7|nr:polyprenyl synthetase family protein [Spirochaeta cellobiosiphila]
MDKYKSRLQKIEASIQKVLPEKADLDWLGLVAGEHNKAVQPKHLDILNKPALELVNRGGKRWRPLVVVLASEMAGNDSLAYDLCPVVELPHNGSLIIDDIEDNSEERRGKPAVHLMYGIDLSINAGNHLYFLPSYVLENLDISAEKKLLLMKYYLQDCRRLHFGQGLDIQWHNNNQYIPQVDEYLQMCRFKTGSLARMAAQLGWIVGGGIEEDALKLGAIWEDIGVGFQILDDVKNLTTGNPGKRRGDDIVEGKKSLPVILYLSGNDVNPEFLNLMNQAKEIGPSVEDKVIFDAIDMMDKNGSISQAGLIAKDMLFDARQRLIDGFKDSEAKDLLIGVLQGFLDKMLS